jgi:hypothetical protein
MEVAILRMATDEGGCFSMGFTAAFNADAFPPPSCALNQMGKPDGRNKDEIVMLENVTGMKAVHMWIAYIKKAHSCELEASAPST